MKTLIISAFPGTGKTHFYKDKNGSEIKILDSDSSYFSWIWKDDVVSDKDGNLVYQPVKTNKRNPEFPKNYINDIISNIGKYDVIFVSTHKEVRDALIDYSIYHVVVYPRMCDKEMFKQRYINRGSDEKFINLMSENWSSWINDCSVPGYGYDVYEWNFSKYNMSKFIEWVNNKRPKDIENFFRSEIL